MLTFPRMLLSVVSVLLALAAGPAVRADVQPAPLFGDHMVLQQGMAVPVWGTASPGERVVVTFGRQRRAATADADGRWMVRLGALKAGGAPGVLLIAGRNTVTIHDVLVGEVWLGSGQSNMDFTVAKTDDKYFAGTQDQDAEIAAANYPQIRMFTVEFQLSAQPQTDVTGHWAVCSPKTVPYMSAAAYFFARDLSLHRHIPVGMVVSTWGASTAQCWTSRPALAADPLLKPLLDTYDTSVAPKSDPATLLPFLAALKARNVIAADDKAAGVPPPVNPRGPRDPLLDQHNPTLLYNGEIAPLIPYAIKGVIWYQGESNGPTASLYFELMKTLITSWRQAWGEGDFPFLSVQLANYNAPALAQNSPPGRSTIALIREGQAECLALPNTGLATAVDIGDAKNIHPKNKQELGRRLALVAEAVAYHEKVVASGPQYAGMTREGDAVRLRFTHTDGGLVSKGAGGTLTGFALAGPDGAWVWADAKIDGDTVIVSSPQVPQPSAVRYAWADNPPVSLYNGAGLPALPFDTATPPARRGSPPPPAGEDGQAREQVRLTEAVTGNKVSSPERGGGEPRRAGGVLLP